MTKRSGIQLCYPFEERRLAKWTPPYVVQPKLDGERCRAVFSGDDNRGYVLLSSENHEINSVPHINQALNKLWNETRTTNEFDGELYRHTMPFHEIHSRVGRTQNIHPNHDEIEFHIFDIVSEEIPQHERTMYLHHRQHWLTKPLVYVETLLAESLKDVMACYDQFLSKGYEGIIVRNVEALYVRKRSTGVMKFKPKKSDWYQIVGVQEEISKDGEPKGTLGALICSGDDGTRFNVGSGLTAALRRSLWERKHEFVNGDHLCHVQYQHITPGKGVPRFPVFVEIVKGGL